MYNVICRLGIELPPKGLGDELQEKEKEEHI